MLHPKVTHMAESGKLQSLRTSAHPETDLAGPWSRHKKCKVFDPQFESDFFVSRALVSLSLSVTGKKRREG